MIIGLTISPNVLPLPIKCVGVVRLGVLVDVGVSSKTVMMIRADLSCGSSLSHVICPLS